MKAVSLFLSSSVTLAVVVEDSDKHVAVRTEVGQQDQWSGLWVNIQRGEGIGIKGDLGEIMDRVGLTDQRLLGIQISEDSTA